LVKTPCQTSPIIYHGKMYRNLDNELANTLTYMSKLSPASEQKTVTLSSLTKPRVCVIGAGTMGAGIAAHLANLGFKVLLLDQTMDLAQKGLDRAQSANPPVFYTQDKLDNIQIGEIIENLPQLNQYDWVCEAIFENFETKQKLYKDITPHLKPDVLFTTNTSGLQIQSLAQDLPESLKSRFFGIHFFNPPRYLKLIELIPTQWTDPTLISDSIKMLEELAGRRVVLAKDTPGFIANRYGMWCIYKAVHLAEKHSLSIETVDYLTGPFLNRPNSGTFRLSDIIGLDVMNNIASNLLERTPKDKRQSVLQTPVSIQHLIKNKNIGAKAGKGYYYKDNTALMALDLNTLEYRPSIKPDFTELGDLRQTTLTDRIQIATTRKDSIGQFLNEYLTETLNYADHLKEEICHNIQDFDQIMEWGFGWSSGPFRLMDQMKLDKQSKPFYKDHLIKDFQGTYISTEPKAEYRSHEDYLLLEKHDGFNIRDLEDGITGIGISTKMGVLDPTLVVNLSQIIEKLNQPTILYTEGKHFSAGFNLNYFLEEALQQNWKAIDQALIQLQNLTQLLSKKRVVAAIRGYCLGGGFEASLGCLSLVANAESQIGLPESKVGLLPAGGGTSRLRLTNQNNPDKLIRLCLQLTNGTAFSNTEEARRNSYLSANHITSFHPDRLITDAKIATKQIGPTFNQEWQAAPSGLKQQIDAELQQQIKEGNITIYDLEIGSFIRDIICLPNSLQEAFNLERKGFIDLLKNKKTHDRIESMLKTGKSLRN
jgi:3-hydroxyacyl-CoA dehydrogenase